MCVLQVSPSLTISVDGTSFRRASFSRAQDKITRHSRQKSYSWQCCSYHPSLSTSCSQHLFPFSISDFLFYLEHISFLSLVHCLIFITLIKNWDIFSKTSSLSYKLQSIVGIQNTDICLPNLNVFSFTHCKTLLNQETNMFVFVSLLYLCIFLFVPLSFCFCICTLKFQAMVTMLSHVHRG